jgi:chromosome segregation ATPase
MQEMVRAFEDEAHAIMCPSGMVLDDYKRLKEERDALERDVAKEGARLDESLGEISATRDLWLPKLRELVATIDENFKNNFASIGCAGEIKLREDGENFRNWRLEIWVKFRAVTDMHILDSHRQSGGERSVSTMLYLISLQELTRAPFRVVDEINQGMDQRNERKIFKRMTDAASKDGTPQTFLLTPKLLNGLAYTEDCTVLCIFNGPWIAEAAKRWREMQRSMQPIGKEAGGPETP